MREEPITGRIDVYGDTGYLYVMLYARYLVSQRKKVLVVDDSEEQSILTRLPLPKEPIDCLYYQGVDYLVQPEGVLPGYDLALHFWGERTEVSVGEFADSREDRKAEVPAVVFSDCSLLRLRWASEYVQGQNALLVVTGVPEYGVAAKLLRRMEICLPEGQMTELPWKSRDARVLLAQEYGVRMSVKKLSRECMRMLRYLSERTIREGDKNGRGVLE